MAKDPGSQYKKPIQEMRRLARERFGNPDELQQLRARIVTERKQAQRTILKKIADRTQIDVASLLDNDRGRREATRRQVAETFSDSRRGSAGARKPTRAGFSGSGRCISRALAVRRRLLRERRN